MNLGLREMLRSADDERPVLGSWALLLSVAAADGTVTANEQATIERCVREMFRLDDDNLLRLRQTMRGVGSDPEDIDVFSRYVRDGAPVGLDDWLVDAVQDVAWADGRPDLHRVRAMLRVAEAVNFDVRQRKRLLKEP
ncbi:MAG: TerB family tellurite resistance protein [Alphaproteobacteria bacterium]|nr:TerB family tellurite resistance protein [Alphaproteobacteria bacterium]